MAAFCVVEQFDVIEHIATSILPRGVDFPLDPFPFQKLETLSATALSRQLPRRLMLATKLFAFKKLRQSVLLYWAALVGMNHHLLLRFWQTRKSIRNQFLVDLIYSSSEIGWRNPIKLPSTPVLIGGRQGVHLTVQRGSVHMQKTMLII